MPEGRVLVVGTTPDYVDHLRRQSPGRAVFITDQVLRSQADQAAPGPDEEIGCDLQSPAPVVDHLREHARRYRYAPQGVACFDCESLELAARVAEAWDLPFPPKNAIRASRSKFLSKETWRRNGIPCPRAALIPDLPALSTFQEQINGPVVLKPLTGSGSELVFICPDRAAGARAWATTQKRLAGHPDQRLYRTAPDDSGQPDPRQVLCAEEFMAGPEYSADFILDQGRLDIIRVAQKIMDPGGPPGTALAYVVPADLPDGLEPDRLAPQLLTAARALGLDRTMGMVDFIVANKTAYLLEMTPRPGGDCLPPLIRQCCGLDILAAALDFAVGSRPVITGPSAWTRLVGLRLLASRAGQVRAIDPGPVHRDGRVKEVYLKHGPGHRIVLPPDDYGSRILGHVIFEPNGRADVRAQCREISGLLRLSLAQNHD